MKYRFWDMNEAMARHDHLCSLIDEERISLPHFRHKEAIDLALTEEEKKEFRALTTLMNFHNFRGENPGADAPPGGKELTTTNGD